MKGESKLKPFFLHTKEYEFHSVTQNYHWNQIYLILHMFLLPHLIPIDLIGLLQCDLLRNKISSIVGLKHGRMNLIPMKLI